MRELVWKYTGARGPTSARESVATVVRKLTRARRDQLLVAHGWTGLFWGLLAACAAVLAIRLGELPYSPWMATWWIVALGLAAAIVVAWQRRPDALHVAIVADLQLNLKQRLSTAWELARGDHDPELIERLSAQAVRARLPLRAEYVFPLRVTTWGKLTPIAASLLVLIAIVDPARVGEAPAPVADPIVVREGVRLREYGQHMQARAEREQLPRSTAASRRVQRLGARMEAGALSREQVLSRLRELGASLGQERRTALGEGLEIKAGPLEVETLEGSRVLHGPSLRAMLRDLLNHQLRPGDLRSLSENATALTRFGVTPEDLVRALDSLDSGDREPLRRLLERLAQADRALRDAEELRRAEQEVQRARENLGDAGVRTARRGEPSGAGADDDAEEAGRASDAQLGDAPSQGARRFASRGRDAGDPAGPMERRAPVQASANDRIGIVLAPKSQLREGRVFVSEMRMLPRAGRPTVAGVALDARFETQLEEVLSKDSYPPHYKEFVRRYFLSLSEGVSIERGAGEAARR